MRRWSTVGLAALMACGGRGPNLFTIQDDIDLGEQIAAEIASQPEDFPVLPRDLFPEAYDHIEALKGRILATGQVRYADTFNWELFLIADDVLNAFVTPGGKIYVYTGLIKFLDREDDLAGVMGHEIAHADRRHSTQQLTKAYGVSALIGIVLGNDPGLLAEIAQGLVRLSFSRADESEADAWSVRYLCETPYAANGAAEFFRRLESAPLPPFLSTHPNPANRVEAIDGLAQELGCSTTPWAEADYDALLRALP
jgi:beta-barrel assembly-enhancing protease